jgi:CBS domain-containing protein
MLRRKIHDLPVTEADGRLVGMISRHDVLRALIASHSLLLE